MTGDPGGDGKASDHHEPDQGGSRRLSFWGHDLGQQHQQGGAGGT